MYIHSIKIFAIAVPSRWVLQQRQCLEMLTKKLLYSIKPIRSIMSYQMSVTVIGSSRHVPWWVSLEREVPLTLWWLAATLSDGCQSLLSIVEWYVLLQPKSCPQRSSIAMHSLPPPLFVPSHHLWWSPVLSHSTAPHRVHTLCTNYQRWFDV